MSWQDEQKKVATGVTGKQEPVAWRYRFGDVWINNPQWNGSAEPDECQPLYTHPQPKAEQGPISDVTEAMTKTVIEVEKLLCEKLGKSWKASGMSIQTLVDELAQPKEEQEPVIGTKTWFDGDKVITQHLHPSDIYKDPQPKHEWIGLRWSDTPDKWFGNVDFMEGAKWAERTLKERNE